MAKKVLIIGGGPGGYIAAIRAAQLSAEVTLVEKEHLGGTCLNVGCIPTKCLIHSAELAEQIRSQAENIGIHIEGMGIDFPQVIRHKSEISKRLVNGVGGLLKANRIRILEGQARFVGEKKVEVLKTDGSAETPDSDAVIVATGSVNVLPPIPGLKECPACIDSTGALSLDHLPESMIVIGGGVIGLEIACAYAGFGTRVTVV